MRNGGFALCAGDAYYLYIILRKVKQHLAHFAESTA